MDRTSRLRLSIGFLSTAICMFFGIDRGRKAMLSPGAVEILYTSYFTPLCMGDIAAMLEIAPSSAADLVNYLEREGYVRRERDPEDRRRIVVAPSEKGELWILETEEKIYGFLEAHLCRLSPDEQNRFADLCARFSGVDDDASFIASIADIRKDRGSTRVPLIEWTGSRLRRLEEVVDERYGSASAETEQSEEYDMFETRKPETEDGIQDETMVGHYDAMQRSLRDQGHLPVDDLVAQTKEGDRALEIGPGPGYYGLEWLAKTTGTRLDGLEISPAMIRIAEQNAGEYRLTDRVSYTEGNALRMPFADGSYDLAFSNGSLHEWEDARAVFDEVKRVLRPGGSVMVTDLRRDLSPKIFRYMKNCCPTEDIQAGFETSVRAAYTKEELESLLAPLMFSRLQVIAHPYGLVVVAVK